MSTKYTRASHTTIDDGYVRIGVARGAYSFTEAQAYRPECWIHYDVSAAMWRLDF